jgi:hypothetical protein
LDQNDAARHSSGRCPRLSSFACSIPPIALILRRHFRRFVKQPFDVSAFQRKGAVETQDEHDEILDEDDDGSSNVEFDGLASFKKTAK